MGDSERREVVSFEAAFPRLSRTSYVVTSPAQPDYNCIAWAAGDDSRWWEPDDLGMYFWPEGIPRRYSVEVYVKVFNTIGFEVCIDGTLESGVEKIAIFADHRDLPTHAARQLMDGSWTSKLGQLEDIIHWNLESVSDGCYGMPVLFLKRLRP